MRGPSAGGRRLRSRRHVPARRYKGGSRAVGRQPVRVAEPAGGRWVCGDARVGSAEQTGRGAGDAGLGARAPRPGRARGRHRARPGRTRPGEELPGLPRASRCGLCAPAVASGPQPPSCRGGGCSGAETCSRWRGPARGRLGPGPGAVQPVTPRPGERQRRWGPRPQAWGSEREPDDALRRGGTQRWPRLNADTCFSAQRMNSSSENSAHVEGGTARPFFYVHAVGPPPYPSPWYQHLPGNPFCVAGPGFGRGMFGFERKQQTFKVTVPFLHSQQQ
ncbi:uncharacterized protein [Vulpes vulpes]|uniref:Uncharacterized protein isoform X2 n=1 Tax=Vulpes vulpes TaxID=9627 RepID=A0ABM5B176_VULVU